MEINKPRVVNHSPPYEKLSNGYTLPVGKLTPNAIFVGGMDPKVEENEIRDIFARYGDVKEVRIMTYRGGICKGYGFVYFGEDVNIQPIIEQHVMCNGRKLKLGPAIMKDRTSRMYTSKPMRSTQYFYCTYCAPVGGGMAPPSPIVNAGSPYTQTYPFSNFGGVMMPQVPVNYAQNVYAYQVQYTPTQWTADGTSHPLDQNFVDCGVQTVLPVL
ncbi:deleted in azoospermia-like isoform X1 [Cynoglossus semilaevis]|uniref:deleted in azoospermia-like isoform X1 n=2 Tax=Cynoglossus semilaevis TaxID=244447 RepID=UPI0007DCB83B|nr:deleted in azoospermia-like isoform X1 [Cynoglossus semilaevis]